MQKRPQESLAEHRRDITTNLEDPVHRTIVTDGDLRSIGLYCVNVAGDFLIQIISRFPQTVSES